MKRFLEILGSGRLHLENTRKVTECNIDFVKSELGTCFKKFLYDVSVHLRHEQLEQGQQFVSNTMRVTRRQVG